MAGKAKHAERSRRSHRSNEDNKRSGLYRMAATTNRNLTMRNARRNQQRGGD